MLTKLEKHQTKREKEYLRHEKAMQKLDAEYRKLVFSCPNTQTKFHPDPSGNNDSEYECLDCGAFYPKEHLHPRE